MQCVAQRTNDDSMSTSFFTWELIIRHPGLIAVLIGVLGEVVCDWREMHGRPGRIKRFFAGLLVVGLAYEFIEAANADKQVATIEANNVTLGIKFEELRKANFELEKQLGSTSVLAVSANKEAATARAGSEHLRTLNNALELRVEELHSINAELEKQMTNGFTDLKTDQMKIDNKVSAAIAEAIKSTRTTSDSVRTIERLLPRRITEYQRDIILKQLGVPEKGARITVEYIKADPEAERFALDIVKVLKSAKYPVNVYGRAEEESNPWPPLAMMTKGKPSSSLTDTTPPLPYPLPTAMTAAGIKFISLFGDLNDSNLTVIFVGRTAQN